MQECSALKLTHLVWINRWTNATNQHFSLRLVYKSNPFLINSKLCRHKEKSIQVPPGKDYGVHKCLQQPALYMTKQRASYKMAKVWKWVVSLKGWSLPLLFDTPLKPVTNALASEISQPEYTGNSLDMALLSGKGLFLKITFFPRYCPPPPTQ